MPTIDQLADLLDTTPDSIRGYVDQISDDPDLWDPDTETITDDGASIIAGQVRSGSGQRDHDSDLTDVIARIDQLSHDTRDALDERDTLIRRMLADGVPYARLGEITGLSRSGLDTIRRGERHRQSGSGAAS